MRLRERTTVVYTHLTLHQLGNWETSHTSRLLLSNHIPRRNEFRQKRHVGKKIHQSDTNKDKNIETNKKALCKSFHRRVSLTLIHILPEEPTRDEAQSHHSLCTRQQFFHHSSVFPKR